MDFKFHRMELKDQSQDDQFFRFTAIASTDQIDSDDDIIEAGAFGDTLGQRRVKMLLQHDSRQPIGRWTEIKQTSRGLEVKGELPLEDTLVSGRVVPQIKAGNLDSLSVGFMVKDWRREDRGGSSVRIIEKADLWEISIVTFPANPGALIESFKRLSDNPYSGMDYTEKRFDREQAVLSVKQTERTQDVYLSGAEFPILDVEDGEVKLSVRGLYSAVAQIDAGKTAMNNEAAKEARTLACALLAKCGHEVSVKWSISAMQMLRKSDFRGIIQSGKISTDTAKFIADKAYPGILDHDGSSEQKNVDCSGFLATLKEIQDKG